MNILLLREALLIAKEYGIPTLGQFEVFITISQADGITITDMAGCTRVDDPDHWMHISNMVAKLVRSDERGESLAYRAEPIIGNVGPRPQKLRLTNKGFRLLAEINGIGFH